MQTITKTVQIVMQERTTKAKPATITPLKLNEFSKWLDLETFDEPDLQKLVRRSADWLESWRLKHPPKWLTILGEPGTGKTHVALRLWQWTSARSDWGATLYQPHVIFWPRFIQRLRTGNAFELRDDLRNWPVVFLDDIGAERDPSGFATDELSALLNARLDKWTLITSNLDQNGLANLDRRIASRIVRGENICLAVKTKDYALR